MTVGSSDHSGHPSFGDGEFASLITDETNTALIEANSRLAAKKRFLTQPTRLSQTSLMVVHSSQILITDWHSGMQTVRRLLILLV